MRVYDNEGQLDGGVWRWHHALALVSLVPLDQTFESHVLHYQLAQHLMFLFDALATENVLLLQGQELLFIKIQLEKLNY